MSKLLLTTAAMIAVINTCGFIGDAKEESINMILEFAQAKEEYAKQIEETIKFLNGNYKQVAKMLTTSKKGFPLLFMVYSPIFKMFSSFTSMSQR